MTYLNPETLEHLNEQELRALHAELLAELRRSGKTLEECPLLMLSLANIRSALQRRKRTSLKFSL